MAIPKPPPHTGPSGLALWESVLSGYDLEFHELALLREAVRTVDQLDKLAVAVNRDGVVSENKVSPALVESRQLRLTLARLLAALRLPTGDEEDLPAANKRPQKRSGPRAPYAIRGA